MRHSWSPNQCISVCVWGGGGEGGYYTDSTTGYFLLATNVFFICIPITWFQSVTVNGFLTSYSAHIQIKFLEIFKRILSLDSLIGYKYLFTCMRIFDILLPACSVLQLHLVFANTQSTDTWLARNIFIQSVNRWPLTDLWRHVLRMCNVATLVRLSETQISKFVLWHMNISFYNSEVICHVCLS